jgi:hypothetical protein
MGQHFAWWLNFLDRQIKVSRRQFKVVSMGKHNVLRLVWMKVSEARVKQMHGGVRHCWTGELAGTSKPQKYEGE